MLYHVETFNLNKAMKRNVDRFPEDFCFQLTKEEYKNLIFQSGISSLQESENKHGGRRKLPYAFTEQGILMLSAVLRSEIAVKVSVKIMRTFVEMRRFMANNSLVLSRINELEVKQLSYQKETDDKFEQVFHYIKVNAFKVVSTFDVSQTDGKELPSLGVDELTGGVDGYGTFLEVLKEVCPVPMSFENIEGGAKGFYSQTEKGIAIQEGMSEAQTVKTAIYEMAHQKLHSIENNGLKQTRGSKEVEAESVAYTVCQHCGIDTSDYSFSYVAGWSEGKEMPELKASLDTIRRAASEMITAIDEKVEELVAQKTQEQIAEVPEGVKPATVDRKEELAELLKAIAEKMSPDAKTKQEEKAVDETKPEEKALEKKASAEKKEKSEKMARPKKTETKNLGEAI